jgi:hypothetical protein
MKSFRPLKFQNNLNILHKTNALAIKKLKFAQKIIQQ